MYKSVDQLRSTLNKAQPPPSAEQMQKLLRLLHEALLSNNLSEDASKLMIDLLGTYTSENASHAKQDAQRCIVASISDPTTYVMDHLLPLKVIFCG